MKMIYKGGLMHRKAHGVVMFTLLLATTTLYAADPWVDAYRFFGRWDRSVAKQAVTVNSGSYILARFTGTSLSATFDVSVNNPPFARHLVRPPALSTAFTPVRNFELWITDYEFNRCLVNCFG